MDIGDYKKVEPFFKDEIKRLREEVQICIDFDKLTNSNTDESDAASSERLAKISAIQGLQGQILTACEGVT